MLNFKGMRFPIDVILVCIRWYAAYPLSYRHLEEIMEERGVSVDHSSINRWAIRFLPLIEKIARKYKRAVDKQGKTVDFLLTAKRDMAAAKRFFDKAMGANGDPNKVAMDKSGANRRPSMRSMLAATCRSLCANLNTSTTLSSRTVAPSSG
jgi:putative transposase